MSNLLKKASIVLTPTAYNDGEALCVKPEDGSGDFDFSRNSAATRVNAQGLVENVQHLGSELITIGNDTSDIVGLSDNQNINIQTSFLTIGKTYQIDFEIYDYVEGSIFLLRPTDLGVGSAVSANGNYTYTVEADASTSLIFRTDGLSTTLKLRGISVKEVIDNTNLPRINYESGCGSWLFEPQSTNIVTQSNLLNAISGGIVTPNAAISPDGTTNAIKVNFGTGSNSGGTIYVGGSSATASTEYTFSFYAKNFSGDGTFRLRLDTDTQTALVNETFVATSEWVRYTHTFTTDATASSFGSSSRFRKSTTTDNNEVLFFGMQLEQQSFATSYIPTSGTSVTRNQDVCNNGGSLASINSTEGTLYFEGSALLNGGSNRVISLSDATNDNLVMWRYDVTASRIISFIRGNSGTYAIKTINGVNQTNNNKIALVWNATNLRVWINGVEEGSVATNDLPIGMDTLRFSNPTGGGNIFFGKTKALVVYKEVLSDSELQELTTI